MELLQTLRGYNDTPLRRLVIDSLSSKASCKGVNRANTDTVAISTALSILNESCSTCSCYLFYLDFDKFIHQYNIQGFGMLREEYHSVYASCILSSTSPISSVNIPSRTPKRILDELFCADYEELGLKIRSGRFRCEKCDKHLIRHGRHLRCESCEVYENCSICDEPLYSKKATVNHYTVKHGVDYYSASPRTIEQYCYSCSTLLNYSTERGKVNVHTCKNLECVTRIEREAKRLSSFNKTLASRSAEATNKMRQNHSEARKRTWKKHKSEILGDGRTKAEHLTSQRAKKQSVTMKRKIADGTFTPCVTNSWAKSRCVYLGKPFRSTFELLFFLLNPHLEYETVRVPYAFKGKDHTYIVDFYDSITKTLYEVKPSSEIQNEKVQEKEKSAKHWCNLNGYTFEYVTEVELKQHLTTLVGLVEEVKDKLSIETFRKLQNTLRRFQK